MAASRSLVVVTRAPGSNAAKTRLAEGIGDAASTRLQWAFLDDTLAWARNLAEHRVLAVFPPERAAELAGRAPGWVVVPQAEGEFGERMRGAVNAGFTAGQGPVAMIATDSPTLPAPLLEQAWELVADDADVALGPAEDGGWVLIACRAPLPDGAFAGVRWSVPQTLADTRAALRRAGLRVAVTQPWYDVDTAADLVRLRRELAGAGARRLPAITGELRRSHLFTD